MTTRCYPVDKAPPGQCLICDDGWPRIKVETSESGAFYYTHSLPEPAGMFRCEVQPDSVMPPWQGAYPLCNDEPVLA